MTIRRLPDDLLARIKAAAAAHGRSLEQELRESLAAVDSVVVPDVFFSEYGNIVWRWARRLAPAVAEFLGALDHAEALVERVVPTEGLWRAAVDQLGTKVLTFDRALLASFPDLTRDGRG